MDSIVDAENRTFKKGDVVTFKAVASSLQTLKREEIEHVYIVRDIIPYDNPSQAVIILDIGSYDPYWLTVIPDMNSKVVELLYGDKK